MVTPEGVLSPGWIRVSDTVIDAVGLGETPPTTGLTVTDLSGCWVLPGFVDLHVHGGGGWSFSEGPPHAARRAAAFHR